jgi:hypothetical protein
MLLRQERSRKARRTNTSAAKAYRVQQAMEVIESVTETPEEGKRPLKLVSA